jgi:RNA polymerase-binding transcription factor DksA
MAEVKNPCSKCGEEIPEGRLNAMPGTTRCVDCVGNHHPKASITPSWNQRDGSLGGGYEDDFWEY